MRAAVWPWLFRLPWFRRFDGYAAWSLIVLRRPPGEDSGDLVCHELCHVWQLQHRPLRMPLSYLVRGYERNPYEEEARRAVEATRPSAAIRVSAAQLPGGPPAGPPSLPC